ncbi:MAG: DNA topoisomerase I [Candidatus Colwellbacteria bacterium RIFCSPLOWO2_12_FULL_44_13]|uniref:DNA topoisomerase 1 n=3 Tax=Candidatus Colwelliibacteriota TaxID=1817904 RepID=A0A1G1Z864_9BACT|nr:MAG: DNA topoisomerase I [Candidatus Colwellbacteria bacterium RIFCSPHIGHO2_12_FULL_44_17]OGY60619.1 MAG: DNA topoisomerase I [Candidatus Colwellbacteria bacterium RIFCSPLOWO2_02_FULL_44_20b]OGY61903.1 MAG: DNA topoisomerase I [Candidatus Colwellbacteria bacterium RIFCSPLOWO2_12_FULL_44_13]
MGLRSRQKKLVIVESPTKAKTISNFLGSDYIVESSYGHVRDLPKGKLGVLVEENFEPQYVIPRKNQKTVTALKKLKAKATSVILATDEDREGEAIAWHLTQALQLDENSTERIVFHEITEPAIQEALLHPRTINSNLVNAQQARRVIDRLVGYKLSPFLWKKISRGLSAGRVQSVALRLIVEREHEIKDFKPDEYWTIEGAFTTDEHESFEASLFKIKGKALLRFDIHSQKEAEEITQRLPSLSYSIADVQKTEIKKTPPAPFTTSTLQQEASKRLRFSSKKTMMLAQRLYENGHITYMRTDSVNLSQESKVAAHRWISEHLGSAYVLSEGRTFKNKSRLAQEAHEAIRPTKPDNSPELFTSERDETRLYDLIWRRFIASQLPHARFDATSVDVQGGDYIFRANGNILIFDGFLKIWQTKFEERNLPHLQKDQPVHLDKVTPTQHFTEPPSRYSEATLIKTLEAYGIGRPSTYAPTISLIQTRNYVLKNAQRKFEPTELGEIVAKVLIENFADIVNVDFTATIEEEFDTIALGGIVWQRVVSDFYGPFEKNLNERYETVSKEDIVPEKTGILCELCGKEMIIKFGRFGKFIACSGYPECKNTKPAHEPPSLDMRCPKCNVGDVVQKRTRKGRIFYGCNRWPECDFASWKNPKEEERDKKTEDRKEEKK